MAMSRVFKKRKLNDVVSKDTLSTLNTEWDGLMSERQDFVTKSHAKELALLKRQSALLPAKVKELMAK